ncbi:BTAD domain-containing putative transcriptional regulator [Streptomyces sp. NBC_00199]|uniref:BTAD domain-containing putative transcriptional regulator n=1 Tax=Streptomyces sp. NBC_00199 TaxID=2975678 RepID=UPI002257FE08|nr:BTAD domain-containing putative transcriptional regulator [Streptomyces sp. NBC_00199]MCX5262456.1 BTAD domain-containing putative transcriptional regulator [Streptomyces sp. NBC_00199]
MTDFRLLGSLELRVAGRAVEPGPPQRRAVLAFLLADAGRPVPIDALVDRLWGDHPPAEARASLYAHIARIRRLLEVKPGAPVLEHGDLTASPRVLRRADGYLLDVAPDQVDLHRFRHLVEQARGFARTDGERALALRQACALWRGEPMAGLPGPWVARARESWKQEYIAALVAWAHCELEAGNHAAVVGRLPDLVAEHPLVEPLAAALMRALHICGRGPEALACFAALRERLAEELGTEPGPDVQRLHQAILRGEETGPGRADRHEGSGGVRPSAVPAAVETRPATGGRMGQLGRLGRLVGRDEEVAVLDRALEDVTTGESGVQAHVVELAGEPGIGKTRLLAELGERARPRGLLVLTGRSVQFDQAPYGAFVDALDDHLASAAPRENPVEALPEAAVRQLAAVFPALWDHGVAAGPVRAERYWLHRAVRSLLEAVGAGGQGLVLSLDDLHWADDATAELIDHLIRHPPKARVLLALAHRPRQIPPRLSAALSRAGADSRVSRVELTPLSSTDAARLFAADMGPGRWRQLYDVSGGNPFYLEALTRMPSEQLAVAVPLDPAASMRDVPRPVRDSLLAELQGLSEPARLCARAAAVLGDSFSVTMVADVAGSDQVRTLAALDELTAHDLVRPMGAPGQFGFRHSLVRAAVYEGAGAGWLISAHGRAAQCLAARGASSAAQASHVQRSAHPGDEKAAELLAEAARDVLTIAPATAAQWTQEALRLLGDKGRLRPELWFQRASALGAVGRLRESRDLLRATLSLLPPQAGDMRVRVVVYQATMEWMLGDYQQAVRLLLRELEDRDGRSDHDIAELEMALAAIAQRTDEFSTAVRWSERALASAERAGDPPRLALARALLALAYASTGEHARSHSHLTRLLESLGAAQSEQPEYIEALSVIGWTELLHARHDSALHHLDQGLELSRRTGNSLLLSDLFAASAHVHLLLGNLDEASRCAEEALEAASMVGSEEASSFAAGVLAATRLWRGDYATEDSLFEKLVTSLHTADDCEPGRVRSVALGILGQAMLFNGDSDGCVRTVTRAGGGPDLPRFEAPTRALWFGLLTSAELARGDLAAAGTWTDRAACAARPDGPHHQRAFIALSRAELHLARQEPAVAARFAQEAAEVFRTCRMPLYEALARIQAGLALAASSERRPDALGQLEQARSLSGTRGAHGLSAWAEAEYRRIVDAPDS